MAYTTKLNLSLTGLDHWINGHCDFFVFCYLLFVI